MRRDLVAIAGSTATGKTAAGEAVAERLGGEVVCADARQLFRELDLGTGKPSVAERGARAHHLFDWLTLGVQPTAGSWARAAGAACEDCFARSVVPVLVGGSGLYLSALRHGLHPEPPKDAALRGTLARDCAAAGVEAMHARLRELDPGAAEQLHARDRQRVLRALEINVLSGHTLAWWRERPREAPLAADWHAWELTCAPAQLVARIESRTRAMWDAGLLDEVRWLCERGFESALRDLAAIGYDEALEHLAGHINLADAQARMNLRTRQLAKRQRTWFRHQWEARSAEVVTDALARFCEQVERSLAE